MAESKKIVEKMLLNRNVENVMKGFLPLSDLAGYSNTSKNKYISSKEALDKAKAKIMLHLVLNSHEENVKKLREMISDSKKSGDLKFQSEQIVTTCSVLIRTQGQEEFESATNPDDGIELGAKQKFVKRKWESVSPLEAAAWSGDIFLVLDLLKHVPKHLYKEAITQLKNVLTEKLEHGVFLATIKELVISYEVFNAVFTEEYNKLNKNWEKIDKVWLEKVGLSLRLLSTYGLQEFCDNRPNANPIPKFNKEPNRTCTVDLGLLGSKFGLYKGHHCGWGGYTRAEDPMGGTPLFIGDMAAMKRLCEVRTLNLENIIKSLENSKLISIEELIPNYNQSNEEIETYDENDAVGSFLKQFMSKTIKKDLFNLSSELSEFQDEKSKKEKDSNGQSPNL